MCRKSCQGNNSCIVKVGNNFCSVEVMMVNNYCIVEVAKVRISVVKAANVIIRELYM